MAEGAEAKKGPSNLAVRFLTALVFLPGFLWLLYAGPWWGFFALAAFAGFVAASELVGRPNTAVTSVRLP